MAARPAGPRRGELQQQRFRLVVLVCAVRRSSLPVRVRELAQRRRSAHRARPPRRWSAGRAARSQRRSAKATPRDAQSCAQCAAHASAPPARPMMNVKREGVAAALAQRARAGVEQHHRVAAA
jgi:hypothetical protein